jgi:hypothetical protein
MKGVASSMFHTMLFPHNGKIVTVDQLTHYEPHISTNFNNILPLIGAHLDISPVIEVGLGRFQDTSLLGTYQGDLPLILPLYYSEVCLITSVTTKPTSHPSSEDPTLHPSPYISSAEYPPEITHVTHETPAWKMLPQALTQIRFFTHN